MGDDLYTSVQELIDPLVKRKHVDWIHRNYEAVQKAMGLEALEAIKLEEEKCKAQLRKITRARKKLEVTTQMTISVVTGLGREIQYDRPREDADARWLKRALEDEGYEVKLMSTELVIKLPEPVECFNPGDKRGREILHISSE